MLSGEHDEIVARYWLIREMGRCSEISRIDKGLEIVLEVRIDCLGLCQCTWEIILS